jgi:hypothetical protein
MDSLKKINLDISILTITEQDQLKGGFISLQNLDADLEGIRNGNCSGSDSWFNSNCGCNACQPSIEVE